MVGPGIGGGEDGRVALVLGPSAGTESVLLGLLANGDGSGGTTNV